MDIKDKAVLALFGLVLIALLVWSEIKQDVVMTYGECIETNALQDGFQGTLQEAWTLYASVCN